jgi:uncharacterized protein YegL
MSMSRRLPIYLLLDCSESMAGQAIDDMSQGIDVMLDALRSDPLAIETAWLSVITFSKYAKQLVPLTDLMSFEKPELKVRTGTAMGAALSLLVQCIKKDVQKTSETIKGDYKPLVFLFTDGQPTDNWQEATDLLSSQKRPSIANIYSIGCGPDVDTEILHRVSDVVLTMKDTSSEAWKKTFIWLSASVQRASQLFERNEESASVDLPALPEVLEIESEFVSMRDSPPRQVFLHAFCAKSGQPYLMRFARRGSMERYVALCSHPLEILEEGEADDLPSINTGMLDGCPSCPYCGNIAAAMCECGVLICVPGVQQGDFTCPKCHRQGMFGSGQGGFDIHQVQG